MIEGLIRDVFINSIPDLNAPVQDYANLQECIYNSFDDKGYDYSASMMTKCLQFYEILRSKHGIIVVGQHQAGKSTLVSLLQTAINKAALNEFMLAVQDKRKTRMFELVREYEAQEIAARILEKEREARGAVSSDFMGAGKAKKPKKNDREIQQKRLLAIYQDLFDKTALDHHGMDHIREQLSIKGVIVRRINPKAMTQDEMFGVFDQLSNEYKEGIFTHEFRLFS